MFHFTSIYGAVYAVYNMKLMPHEQLAHKSGQGKFRPTSKFWKPTRSGFKLIIFFLFWSGVLALWTGTWLGDSEAPYWAALRASVYRHHNPYGSNDWVVLTTVNNGFYDFFTNWWAHYELLGAPMPVYVIAQVR